MGRRGLAPLLVVLVVAGCTRVIDTPRPLSEPPVAPVTAGQVGDLLSEKVHEENQKRKDENVVEEDNLFVTVEPEECAGIIREVDPPFIFDAQPAAHDGGDYFSDSSPSVSVVEMVGVYRADFDPKAAIDEVKRVVESCQNDELFVTAMEGQELEFRLIPQPDSGSPHIVLWSVEDVGWACDNAYVAAHNAAVEITTCWEENGYDVLSLARDALKRIDTLAKTTA